MKTPENAFNELHEMVTLELMERVKTGEATTADLRAAIEWLKVNGITGVATETSPLSSLAGVIPELDFSEIQGYLK